jgi:hypothetical protein
VSGTELITAERARQQAEKGYTPEHDSEHGQFELARAGMIYAGHAVGYLPVGSFTWVWPNGWEFKPSTTLRELVMAGALIAAEIDRLLALGEPS